MSKVINIFDQLRENIFVGCGYERGIANICRILVTFFGLGQGLRIQETASGANQNILVAQYLKCM
jgi:hypothetical protein